MYAWLVAGAIVIALVRLSVMLNRHLASLRGGVPNDLPERDSPKPTAREGGNQAFVEDDTAPGVLTPPEWRGKNATQVKPGSRYLHWRIERLLVAAQAATTRLANASDIAPCTVE
jgi:hypothetical protein